MKTTVPFVVLAVMVQVRGLGAQEPAPAAPPATLSSAPSMGDGAQVGGGEPLSDHAPITASLRLP